MAAYWIPPEAILATNSNVVHIHVTGGSMVTAGPFCTCQVADPGFACVAQRHQRQEEGDWVAALEAIERRAEYRDFVGHPPAPRAAVSRDSRRARTAAHRRTHAWRTRALGKRPGLTASG